MIFTGNAAKLLNRNGLVELMIVLSFVLIIFAGLPLLGLWTDRNLDFWLTNLKGHAVNVPYWLSLVLSIVLSFVALVLNIVAEIARFAV